MSDKPVFVFCSDPDVTRVLSFLVRVFLLVFQKYVDVFDNKEFWWTEVSNFNMVNYVIPFLRNSGKDKLYSDESPSIVAVGCGLTVKGHQGTLWGDEMF